MTAYRISYYISGNCQPVFRTGHRILQLDLFASVGESWEGAHLFGLTVEPLIKSISFCQTCLGRYLPVFSPEDGNRLRNIRNFLFSSVFWWMDDRQKLSNSKNILFLHINLLKPSGNFT
jgi:hypothetical protein